MLAAAPAVAADGTTIAAPGAMREPAVAPSPLVAIDRNRATIVERIAADWGDALSRSGAGVDADQLRTLLAGLRADHLLAASLAGSLEGLRNVIANALTSNAPVADRLLHPKAIGDAGDDLVYTPIVPCRVLDSRGATGGALQSGQTRSWLAANPGGSFSAQGGAATDCGIPVKPAAVLVNLTVANTTGASNFLVAWPYGTARPNASVLNWTSVGQQIANAVVVPLCAGACADDFSTYASSRTDLIADALGYFAPPVGGGGVSGGGTANALAKWSGTSTLGAAAVVESGGQVGIGTAAPVNKLQIGSTPPSFVANDLAIGNGANGMSFFQSDSASTWYSSENFSLMPLNSLGWVGIGTQAPHNRVQIGETPGFSGNDLAIGDGSRGMSFFNAFNTATWYSDRAFALLGSGSGSGWVGIGASAPTNRLQIGSVGATGYSANHIAFGNGTEASGIAQQPSVAQWYSTTNIGLMPRNGTGTGGVGINTTTPGAPLEVDGSYHHVASPDTFAYFKADGSLNPLLGRCQFCAAEVSILASGNVWAAEFDTQSDARIKDIEGVTDSAHDLDLLAALRVFDYTLRDKLSHGNRRFKKVVAQQVEDVFPQVVSKGVGFVPNVYRTTSAVVPGERGLLLRFDGDHGLTPQAQRLKLLASGESTMRVVAIVAVPSSREVVVDARSLSGGKVFVYGEEVPDFRTVDYEGLTALNISATQELARRMARQLAEASARAAESDAKIANLERRLAEQTARFAALERDAADVAPLKAQVAAIMRATASAPVALAQP